MKVLSLLKVMPGLLFDMIFIWLYLSIKAVGHFSEIRIVFFYEFDSMASLELQL